jgi:hypothetical protein
MEQQEIDKVFLPANVQAILVADEGEDASHLPEKGFHPRENRLFQLTLGVLVAQFKEVERVLVFDRQVRLVSDFGRQRFIEVGLVHTVFWYVWFSMWWIKTFFDQPNCFVRRR